MISGLIDMHRYKFANKVLLSSIQVIIETNLIFILKLRTLFWHLLTNFNLFWYFIMIVNINGHIDSKRKYHISLILISMLTREIIINWGVGSRHLRNKKYVF